MPCPQPGGPRDAGMKHSLGPHALGAAHAALAHAHARGSGGTSTHALNRTLAETHSQVRRFTQLVIVHFNEGTAGFLYGA